MAKVDQMRYDLAEARENAEELPPQFIVDLGDGLKLVVSEESPPDSWQIKLGTEVLIEMNRTNVGNLHAALDELLAVE